MDSPHLLVLWARKRRRKIITNLRIRKETKEGLSHLVDRIQATKTVVREAPNLLDTKTRPLRKTNKDSRRSKITTVLVIQTTPMMITNLRYPKKTLAWIADLLSLQEKLTKWTLVSNKITTIITSSINNSSRTRIQRQVEEKVAPTRDKRRTTTIKMVMVVVANNLPKITLLPSLAIKIVETILGTEETMTIATRMQTQTIIKIKLKIKATKSMRYAAVEVIKAASTIRDTVESEIKKKQESVRDWPVDLIQSSDRKPISEMHLIRS